MLTEAAAREREGEESAARVAMGLDKGIWGRFVGFALGVIGFIAGLTGVIIVTVRSCLYSLPGKLTGIQLLLIDLSISAYDCSVPLPSSDSRLVTVHPPKSPWTTRIHMACSNPPNSSDLTIQSTALNRKHLPTVLYESPSGVPGSLALLGHPLPPSALDAENPGKWIYDLQEKGQLGRVCVWDRPGYGFSDVLSGADLGIVADALYDALRQYGELGGKAGFILVGEGYGR